VQLPSGHGGGHIGPRALCCARLQETRAERGCRLEPDPQFSWNVSAMKLRLFPLHLAVHVIVRPLTEEMTLQLQVPSYL